MASLSENLTRRFPSLVTEPGLEPTFLVPAAALTEVARYLRDDPACRMELLACETATDHPPDRLRLVCNLVSTSLRQRVCLHVDLPRTTPQVASLVPLWSSANFFEREIFDLFGIVFDGHPNLRRIMMDDDFVGHPLRKDFTSPHLVPRPER